MHTDFWNWKFEKRVVASATEMAGRWQQPREQCLHVLLFSVYSKICVMFPILLKMHRTCLSLLYPDGSMGQK